MLLVGTLQVAKTSSDHRDYLLEMLDSEPVPGDTIRNRRSPSVTLQVTLVGKTSSKQISTRALLDSRAEGIIIDHSFARKHQLTLHTLVNPLPVKNVDGTLNKQGSVRYTMIQKIRIMTLDGHFHEELSELYVTTLGDQDIILGTDWLRMHNPEVDWAGPQITFTRCPPTCTLSKVPLKIRSDKLQTRTMTINAMIHGEDTPDQAANEFAQDAMEAFLYNHSFSKYDNLAIRAKTTTSTTIVA